LVGAKGLSEKTSTVLKNIRNQYHYIFQVPGLDSYIHRDV
jgi:hypothetical protein